MSDFLAVAGVSAVLKGLLSNAITSAGLNTSLSGGMANVSALSPDLVPVGPTEQPTLNLFMYYASLNPTYREMDLPWRDSDGKRVSNPPLALNLHYLMSAYGKTEFDPEILLAFAMQILHENPVLSRTTIQNLLTALGGGMGATPEMQAVAQSTLAAQVELIKIAPESLSNEEISKLWMAFNTHYRPTTSYQVSVVLIQETLPLKSNLPVQARAVQALPFPNMVIENISPSTAVAGDILAISGRNFLGDDPAATMISFDNQPPVAPASIQPGLIRVAVPPPLLAGLHSVRIVRNVLFGSPGDPHTGFASSPAQWLLAPTITDASPVAANVASPLTIHLNPPVGLTQRAALFIGDASVQLDARTTGPPTSTSLTFQIPADFPHSNPAVAAPLRISVDGIESKLTQDQNPASPTFGQFLPQAVVTGP